LLGLFWDAAAVAGGRNKRNYWRKNRLLFKPGSGANEEAEIRVNAHFCEYDPEQYHVKYGSLKSVFEPGRCPVLCVVSVEPQVRCSSQAGQAGSKPVAALCACPA